MSLSVGENVGPYRIVEQLGQGGMATVFKAYHASLDRYVAIKVLHAAFKEDPNFQARFQREARVVARLEHPNIVPVYDFAEHNGSPYLVMKFIEGETLKARMSRAPLGPDEVLRLMEAAGAGLDYAHQQGILHRDIKPSNLMLGRAGGIYIADFGLARIAVAGESTLSTDAMLGTPNYMSPEQARGNKELDSGTDIYSLGVVLYELVVGRVPYSADTPFAVIHDHIYTPLPMPRSLNPKVPEAVERVLLKALAKERADRFADAGTFVRAYRSAVSGADTFAAPATRPAAEATRAAPPDDRRTVAKTIISPARPPATGGYRFKWWHAALPAAAAALAGLLWLAAALLAPVVAQVTPTAQANTPPPAPTEPVAATQPPAATRPPPSPTPAEAAMPGLVGEVSLLYAYGSAEEEALLAVLGLLREWHPELVVSIEQSSFEDVGDIWRASVAAGDGPDLLVFPNDDLGSWVRDGLVAPLDDELAFALFPFSRRAVEGVMVADRVYAVPGTVKAVAMFYNRALLPEPPATVDGLLELVESGLPAAFYDNPYHNYGFFTAFGGELFDDGLRCVADRGGFAAAMEYLSALRRAGAVFSGDGGLVAEPFRQRQQAVFIDGPWALPDYRANLGDVLGLAPLPAGPAGPARPLVGVDGWYVNPNLPPQQRALAAAVALEINSAEGQQIYAEIAGAPPSRIDVPVGDPLIQVFAESANLGLPRPVVPEMASFWGPFIDEMRHILFEGAAPEAAVREACRQMNELNGK